MPGEDHVRWEASFGELDSFVARSKAILEEQAVKAEALGDSALASRIRNQMQHTALGGTGAAEVQRGTQAIREQAAAVERNSQLNLFNLETIQRQARAEAELAAATRLRQEQTERVVTLGAMGRAKAAVIPGQTEMFMPGTRAPVAAGLEQQLVLERYMAQATQAEGAGRAEVLRVQEQQLAADAARARALAEQRSLNLQASAAPYGEHVELEAQARQRALTVEREQLATDRERASVLAAEQVRIDAMTRSYQAGMAAAARGRPLTTAQQGMVTAVPAGLTAKEWSAADRDLMRYNVELGKYAQYSRDASVSTMALNSNLTRLGVAETQASNALRRHGALTTEFLTALARGETTLNEFGYQLGATVGKFAGWTVAATATYGALGAVAEFGKGALDASAGVQQLTRTIDNLDREKATHALINLSSETNVPIKEASDAMFQFSRTFHDVDEASQAARLGLSAFKLDQVALTDNVRLQTELHTQYAYSLQQIGTVYDMLSAGQREYNARMQQTIPLVTQSAGAVRNAGGDLNSLVQLAIFAQRTLPAFGGTQLGTAFRRSAATFMNPETTKGQADRRVVSALGINVDQGWTGIMHDALIRALSLNGQERNRLALAMFGPQLGARMTGLFLPEAISNEYQAITGQRPGAPGQRPITPGADRGQLQQELSRQLQSARERLHGFINELQRTGAAIADSGVLSFFSTLLGTLTGVGKGIREVVQSFDQLSPSTKQLVTGLLLLRGAMLFLNRTRFGASFGPISRIARIPGLDPSYESQQARGLISRGTRAAMQTLEDDIAKSTASSLTTGARMAALGQQRAVIERQIAAGDGDTRALKARSNEINEQIKALDREQIVIETEKAAQMEALVALKRQQVAITSSNRNVRASNAEMVAFSRGVQGGGDAAAVGAAGGAAAGLGAAGGAATQAATVEGVWAARMAAMSRGRERLSYAFNYSAARTEEFLSAARTNMTAIGAAYGGVGSVLPVVSRSGGMLSGLGSRLSGLARALDPLTLAIIGLPFLIDKLNQVRDAADKADAKLTPVVSEHESFQQFRSAVDQAWKTTAQRRYFGPSFGGFNPLQESDDSLAQRIRAAGGSKDTLGAITHARQKTYASPVQQVGYTMDELTAEAQADIKAFDQHKISKAELERRFRELDRSARSTLEVLVAPDAQHANQAISDLTNALHTQLGDAFMHTAKGAHDYLDALDNLTPKQLEQSVQALSARANVFGMGGKDISHAAATYLFLAGRARNSSDPTTLQQVQTAQQTYISAVTKNVQEMTKASDQSSTYGGEMSGLQRAAGAAQQARDQAHRWAADMIQRWGKLPGFAKAINDALHQIDRQLGDQMDTVIQAQIQDIEAQASYRSSLITGSTPQAQVARAQTELQGLRQAYDKAKSEGAGWKILGPLLTEINTKMNDLAQQQMDNARTLLQSQTALATSQIQGVGPGPDLARARSDLGGMYQKLALDQSQHRDQATINADLQAINDQQRSINQTIQQQAQQAHQNALAYIASQTALAASGTNDPIKQARIQLAGDLRALASMQPGDYQTQTEYLTARNQALAKINQERSTLHEDLVQADLRNLRFEHDIHHIGDAAYVDGLRKILRDKKLTIDERQSLLTEIYNVTHQNSQLDLNAGSIKFPSVYQIRRAIGMGRRGELPGAQNTTVNHSAVVIVNVTGTTGAAAVGRVLDAHLNTSVTSAMRAAGVIG